MRYDSEKHHRRSIRLKGYDYSQPGAYFITIVTQDRACLFGEIVVVGANPIGADPVGAGPVEGLVPAPRAEMRLNDAGRMVHEEWNALPNRFPNVRVDAFIVMPNHIHGIIIIIGAHVGAGLVPAPDGATPGGATTRVAPTGAPTVGDIVGAFKSITTVSYIRGIKQWGWPPCRGRLWQRNYYEHIIRSDEELQRIRRYILDNPANWVKDRENPAWVPIRQRR